MTGNRNIKLKNARSRQKQSRGKAGREHSGLHSRKFLLFLGIICVLGLAAATLKIKPFTWISAFTARAVKTALHPVTGLPEFTIRQVIIEGAEHLDKEKIESSSGIRVGDNIFEVNLGDAAESLKAEFAAEDFIVFRKLPGTIVIRVLERRPVALINVGKLVGVDDDGVPLPHIGADMVDTLPIITGVRSIASLSDPEVKKRLLSGLRLLDAITAQAPGVQKRISEINISNSSTMGFNLIDTGLEVIIGESGWAEKLPNLEKVITQVTGRTDTIRVLDMRIGEKIYLKKSN